MHGAARNPAPLGWPAVGNSSRFWLAVCDHPVLTAALRGGPYYDSLFHRRVAKV